VYLRLARPSLVSSKSIACFLVVVCCTALGTARAQDTPFARVLRPPVTLQLQISQPGTTVSVETADAPDALADSIVLRCHGDCTAQLPPRRYKLILHRQGSEDDDSQVVRLTQPMLYRTLAPNQTLRSLGVTSLIVGGLLAVSGLGALAVVALSSICESYHCGASPTVGRYALIATPSGLVLAAVGFILFANNRRAFARVKLTNRTDVRLGMSASSSSVTGVATLTF
jgi:hypothetical protein